MPVAKDNLGIIPHALSLFFKVNLCVLLFYVLKCCVPVYMHVCHMCACGS